MTRVDFYITSNSTNESRAQLACRIAEKAYQKDNRIYIHTENREQAEQLDQMLWTFRQGSFLPHCLADDANHEQAAILIGYTEPPACVPEVLINVSQEIPGFFSRFERVAEVVAGDEVIRQKARERFKFYRERGYPLETHELSS